MHGFRWEALRKPWCRESDDGLLQSGCGMAVRRVPREAPGGVQERERPYYADCHTILPFAPLLSTWSIVAERSARARLTPGAPHQYVSAVSLYCIHGSPLTSKHLVYLLGGYPGGRMWDLVAELSSSGPASWEPGESAGPRRGSQQVGEVFTRQRPNRFVQDQLKSWPSAPPAGSGGASCSRLVPVG